MNYEFIGWCREDNHDKVWIMLQTSPSVYFTIWGRRGKKLQTKQFSGSVRDVYNTIESKTKKGYTSVSKKHLDEVYPEFEQDLEKTAVWAMLAG